ncbi:MAG: PilZ domain-containing protein [Candidatus Omnitrophica bacterium]|nr:PilZ domain-containing protein [Candidatus Omnitrophota bacterium]
MWDGINRRRFPRANYKCVISLKSGGDVPKILTAQTQNLGMGGLCVMLKEGLDLFKNVGVELLLDDGKSPIRCDGSIVWVVKKNSPKTRDGVSYDIGIEFLDIKDVDKKRLGVAVDKALGPS